MLCGRFGPIDVGGGFQFQRFGSAAYDETFGMRLPRIEENEPTCIVALVCSSVVNVVWRKQRDTAVPMLVVVP